MSQLELLVSGIIRGAETKFIINIPREIRVVIIAFYPNYIEFEENTINLTAKEMEMITSWFIDVFDLSNKKVKIESKLLYDYVRDGTNSKAFHEKCDGNVNTFTIVESTFGHIFGGFTSKELQKKAWVKNKDQKAFLCLIRSCFENKSPALYKIRKQNVIDAYYHGGWGPTFGRDLRIMSKRGESSACHEYTYYGNDGDLIGNTLCGGIQFNPKNEKYGFDIKEMNTFTIIFS